MRAHNLRSTLGTMTSDPSLPTKLAATRPLRRQRSDGGGGGQQGARVARPPGPSGAATVAALVLGRVPPTELFARVAREYPRLAHARLGREHLYFANHPDTVREVYVTQGRFTVKGRALQRSRPLLGDGLLTSEGDLWRQQRRLVQPAFHSERIEAYAGQMVESALEHAAARWADGRSLDLASDMATLTLTIVGRALFGSDLRDDAAEVGRSLAAMVEQFQRRVLPGTELLDRLPLPSNRRSVEAIERLDALVDRIVTDHRCPGDHRGSRDHPDMLTDLIESGMPERLVRDEVMTLLLAGHETTANALTWAWFLLSRHRDARQRLQAEVAATLGGRHAAAADVELLPWTRAVVAETLRLYPPAWSLGRRLTADLVVDGWTLPTGSLVVASQWVLHRDPRFWSDAGSFRPERWLDGAGVFDEGAPGQPRGSWFPFGLGSRVCIGEPFAWTEAVLVLATLAQAWEVEIPAAHRPEVDPAVTLRPKGGMPAVLHARQSPCQ